MCFNPENWRVDFVDGRLIKSSFMARLKWMPNQNATHTKKYKQASSSLVVKATVYSRSRGRGFESRLILDGKLLQCNSKENICCQMGQSAKTIWRIYFATLEASYNQRYERLKKSLTFLNNNNSFFLNRFVGSKTLSFAWHKILFMVLCSCSFT